MLIAFKKAGEQKDNFDLNKYATESLFYFLILKFLT